MGSKWDYRPFESHSPTQRDQQLIFVSSMLCSRGPAGLSLLRLDLDAA